MSLLPADLQEGWFVISRGREIQPSNIFTQEAQLVISACFRNRKYQAKVVQIEKGRLRCRCSGALMADQNGHARRPCTIEIRDMFGSLTLVVLQRGSCLSLHGTKWNFLSLKILFS